MAQWAIRIGNIESINYAVKHRLVGVGWHEMGDLTKCKKDADFYNLYLSCAAYQSRSMKVATRHINQIRSFLFEIKKDDTVYLPIRGTQKLYEGKVLGIPSFLGDPHYPFLTHIREVAWERQLLREDLGESAVKKLKSWNTIIRLS